MPSEKVTRILKSYGLAEEEISKFSEAEAWTKLYSIKSEQPKTPKRLQICFTGFTESDKKHLWDLALKVGFDVMGSVTKKLNYLVIGPNPGPSKLEKAKEQKVTILKLEDFMNLIETGELPISKS